MGLYCVESEEEDLKLIDELFDIMHENASDFTSTFRKLSIIPIPKDRSESNITESIEFKLFIFLSILEIINEFVELSPSQDTILARYRPDYSEAQLKQVTFFS